MTESESDTSARLGVIAATGTDASDFLRAQLTNDVLRLGPDRHFLTGWCDASGRTLMIARVVESAGGYLLILPQSLIESVLKRLRMFVLRAKVDLADVTAAYRLDGVTGADLPQVNATEYDNDTLRLGLPTASDGGSRALVLAPTGTRPTPHAEALDSEAWQLGDIDAGVPTLYPETQGLFVPQMLNLHWLLGIDFDKGCYPGQEIVARLHYRGRLTRRLFRLGWSGRRPNPGDSVLDSEDVAQGTVMRCAAIGENSGRLLAVLRTNAINGPLQTQGAALDLLDLPYATPD